MLSYYLSSLLVICTSLVQGSTITRTQQDPLPVCGEQTVCTEISTLPSLAHERNYFSWMSCRCPSGQICPSKPGKQTLRVADNKWYGLCQPIEELPNCEPMQISEEVFMGGNGVQLNKYTELHCLCSENNMDDKLILGNDGGVQTSSVWTRTRKNDPRADMVYEFQCAGDMEYLMPKRGGGRYRGRGGFRKFYFY